MRNAAAEMQRQNATGAAASAEQAAEALKRLERQVRGSSADGRQRTAGELRLEAQQIAEAQRRAAAEATRLEKERSASDRATSDALRRLAAEKDKLADRIDRLQQAAREAERDAPGAEGAPFREAGQQLQGQQVGTRMRDSARELRDRASETPAGRQGGGPGQAPPGTQSAAQREQQLTRALEAVANALNGGGQEDGRKLTEQLDRTREMRDRLNALEQQLRAAEAQAGRGREGNGQRDGNGQRVGAAGRASGREGEQPAEGRGSGGAGADAVQRARQEYLRELQRTNETLGRMRAEQRGGGGSTPEEHEFSRSAPGNEAFKQDFSNWESLRKNVDLALEQFEAAASDRLAPKNADRLSAGGSERIPDAYRPLVSRYFEAIAKAKK
jgi:colicin import membrane protein